MNSGIVLQRYILDFEISCMKHKNFHKVGMILNSRKFIAHFEISGIRFYICVMVIKTNIQLINACRLRATSPICEFFVPRIFK
jgi:hypothetical protein